MSSLHKSDSQIQYQYGSVTSPLERQGLMAAATTTQENDNDSGYHTANSTTVGASTSEGTHATGENHHHNTLRRRLALELSLWINVFVTITKLVAYIQTLSLSVLAALVDSVLDIVSQLVLNYTEKHSSLSRSSALYPAGASRLEPVGVLTCAALMGMASFEVIKESIESLASPPMDFSELSMLSFWSLMGIVILKLGLLWLCKSAAAEGSKTTTHTTTTTASQAYQTTIETHPHSPMTMMMDPEDMKQQQNQKRPSTAAKTTNATAKHSVQLADPTLEALAQDHWNDALSNMVAAVALLLALRQPTLWWVDPVGAILISFYIIHSWYATGKEQVEQLTGKAAPKDFLDELYEIANTFDDRIMMVDVCRAYHFGPKFLVELEVVLPKDTLLWESHDLGMELQYEIEGREEVERCFVHIDYQSRPYDEHVVSKVPELREKYRPQKHFGSANSV